MKNKITFCSTKTRRYFIINCIVLLISFSPAKSYCQEEAEYDEMVISLTTRIVGNAEIPAIIYNQQAFLPVSDLFDFLRLQNNFSLKSDSLSGFLLNQEDVFIINKLSNTIFYKGAFTQLTAGSIFYKEDDYYLRTDIFGTVFQLECKFNFRSLAVALDTHLDLPFMKEQRQQQMRMNLKSKTGTLKPDSIIENKSAFLKPGMLDWDVFSAQSSGQSTYTAKLGLGLSVLGGEANLFFNYDSRQKIDLRNQGYHWRYQNNDAKFIKQITAGRVTAPASLSLYAPLTGFQISNTSSRPKQSFGTILVNNQTEPGWIVELYVNDVLVNYTKADATGMFSFEVPMMYGSCNIRYKYYGPFGEMRETTEQMNIPFTFLQPGTIEYSLTAGITNTEEKNKFSKLNVNYGLAKRVTIGSAIEYNSQVGTRNLIPLLTASIRLGGQMIIAAEHSPGIVSRANANYRFKSMQVEAGFVKYDPLQNVVRTANRGEKKLSVSLPYRFNKWGGFSRFTYNDIELYKGSQKSAEWMLAGSFKMINANISTSATVLDPAYVQTRVSLSFKGPFSTRINPQVTYHYSTGKISMWKMEAEKRFGKQGIVNLSYEYNELVQASGFSLSWRQDLSFMQVGASVRNQNKSVFTSQFAGGSVLLANGKLAGSSQKNVGTGAVTIRAFLDKNFNGKKDDNEINVEAPRIKAEGAQVVKEKKGAGLTLSGLEPFETYMIQLDAGSYENPSWRIEQKIIQLKAEPNVFKTIEIPVIAAGEVAGFVYNKELQLKKGQSRVHVNIYNEQNELVAKALTEADGYFSYLGLKPGRYRVSVDPKNLERLNKVSLDKEVFFNIQSKEEGDFVDNVELLLSSKEAVMKSVGSFFSL